MPVPVILSNGTEIVYQCVHGGTWSVSVTSQDAKEGSSYVVYSTLTPSVITPCPATPSTHGVPPCVMGSLIGSGALKIIANNSTVLSSDVQVSTSNGIPLIPKKTSTKVIA